jgi:hypothetical protein
VDIKALTEGMGLFSSALTALKQVIDLLPDGSQKAEAAAALERAEREFRIAESETAKRLDYELCRKHWPPEIMLSESEEYELWVCPKCGNKRDKTPRAPRTSPRPRLTPGELDW